MFIEKLKRFRKRSGMYILEQTLLEAISFVGGMQFMASDDMSLSSFTKWLIDKKFNGGPSPFGWPKLVCLYVAEQGIKEPNDQVEAFFNLLFEFLEDQNLLTDDPEG